jgi:hypothetical protein
MPFTTNYIPATASEFVRSFVTLVVAAGGTAVDHSDGASVNSGAPAANNTLNGADRWARVKIPYVDHEFCIQLYTAASNGGENQLRITVSPGGFANDGTTTTTPTAADQQTLCGSGSNASPGYAGALPNKATQIFQMFVSADSSKPGFWVKTYPIGGGETDVVWMMDPVIPHLGAADLDPFVYWVATSANLRNGYAFDNITGGPWAYIDYTGMNEQFVHTAACFFYQKHIHFLN